MDVIHKPSQAANWKFDSIVTLHVQTSKIDTFSIFMLYHTVKTKLK